MTIYDATVTDEVLDQTVALYREVYKEVPYLEGEEDFLSFARDLPLRRDQVSFRLVVARIDNNPIGFALGHQLPADTRWWEGSLVPLPREIVAEYPGRTFAVIELAVCKPYRRRSLGRRIHAHLIADLREERTTLLVRPDAEPAVTAYRRWGYNEVGRIQPYRGSPVYNAMIRGVAP